MELLDPDRLGLLAVAQEIHMHATGSATHLAIEELDRYAHWLQCRVDNWRPPYKFTREFDDAVLSVCQAALAEIIR